MRGHILQPGLCADLAARSASPSPNLCDIVNKIINKGSIENGCRVCQIFSPSW
jgi:hypothetical protein